MRWTRLVVTGGIAWVAACTFGSLDDLTGAGDGGTSDGASVDGSSNGDASGDAQGGETSGGHAGEDGGGGAGDGAAQNLLTNPGFEQGTGGCGTGWSASNATFVRSNVARTGSSSCELCASPSTVVNFELNASTSVTVPAGTYYAEAWLHADPNGAPVSQIGTQVYATGPGASQVYFQAPIVQPGAMWLPSGKSFTLDAGASVQVDVHAYVPDGGCVLVDDVALYAQ